MAKIKEITQEEASEIIDTRLPLGKFLVQEGDIWVGIDNTDGNAWTEDFKKRGQAMMWLNNALTK